MCGRTRVRDSGRDPQTRNRGVLGIFGGAFDPVHLGHIKLALALQERFDFEQIRFIPCRQPPHKKATFAGMEHRRHMLTLVTDSTPAFIVDDRELKRPGPSYTIDTLRELREQIGATQVLVLILGIDAFLDFCSWHEYGEILSICHIMLLRRPGYHLEGQGCEQSLYEKHGTDQIAQVRQCANGFIFLTDEEQVETSSSVIRRCISEGRQPRYLLPGNVWKYIREHDLYRDAQA